VTLEIPVFLEQGEVPTPLPPPIGRDIVREELPLARTIVGWELGNPPPRS
jgi:hypothetical protein